MALQTSALSAHGWITANSASTSNAYKFNGTSWSSTSSALNNVWGPSGTGSSSDEAFTWCGNSGVFTQPISNTRKFNGTSWSYTNNYPTNLYLGFSSTSVSSLGLSFAGNNGSTGYINNTYKLT